MIQGTQSDIGVIIFKIRKNATSDKTLLLIASIFNVSLESSKENKEKSHNHSKQQGYKIITHK